MGYGGSALLQVCPTASSLQILNTATYLSSAIEIIVDLINMQISLHAVNETLAWAMHCNRRPPYMIHKLTRVYVINTFWRIFKIVSALLSRFHVFHSSCTGLAMQPRLSRHVTTKKRAWTVEGFAKRSALPHKFLDFCGSFPIYTIEQTSMDFNVSSFSRGGLNIERRFLIDDICVINRLFNFICHLTFIIWRTTYIIRGSCMKYYLLFSLVFSFY